MSALPAEVPVTDRFFAKVQVSEPDRCWLWTGRRSPRGYGVFWLDGKNRRAHRVSYEMHIGAISDGVFVCHECDNPPCVNPAHLFLGTHLDNVRDMCVKGRHAESQRTHCPGGHAYNEANTYIAKNGSRHCRVCDREQARARRKAGAR